MFLVVILHVLGHGGVLKSAQGTNFSLAWLLEISAYCAVNCFGLISGYVGYTAQERPYRYRKYIPFWLQVVFYNFGITLIAFIFRLPSEEPTSLGGLIVSAFPIRFGGYWYVNCYTGLFFVIPWLNKLIQGCSKKENSILILLLIVFSVQSTIHDPYELAGGYSFAWLVILYIIGAWIKKYDIPHRLKNRIWMLLLVGAILLTWLWKELFDSFPGVINKFFSIFFSEADLFINYVSPTVLLIAICYVCIFSKFTFSGKTQKTIHFFSPAAFGVYLIHVHSFIWNSLFPNSFSWIASVDPWLLIPLVLGCTLGIFVVCLLIDVVRLRIFKFLRVEAGVDKLSSYVNRLVHRLFSHLKEQ